MMIRTLIPTSILFVILHAWWCFQVKILSTIYDMIEILPRRYRRPNNVKESALPTHKRVIAFSFPVSSSSPFVKPLLSWRRFIFGISSSKRQEARNFIIPDMSGTVLQWGLDPWHVPVVREVVVKLCLKCWAKLLRVHKGLKNYKTIFAYIRTLIWVTCAVCFTI